jgi:protein phosphatase 4 regulatory subunit 3
VETWLTYFADDPDFPSHRANHRQYLSDSSKFKEVVPITTPEIRQKIHYTYRLLYLKDVVLARILDDPTFSVLNSLIFFHQVDIVNHIQSNQQFLGELFSIFAENADDAKLAKRKEAVLFIQNCCAVSKNIQAPNRNQLYQNFIQHGLFTIITFALRHHDASVRVAGTDILVALIDHDPHLVRSQIFQAIREKQTPLTDTLIELLLVEVDLGVKSQMADAIKILLDPGQGAGMEMMRASQANNEIMAKRGVAGAQQGAHSNPQTDTFISSFYDGSAKRLFQPLKDLEFRSSMQDLTAHETSMMTHLVDCLCFFVRQHAYRSKLFILGENLHSRVAQLLRCPHKYMKLTALKWFRTCIGLQDEFHNRQLIQHGLFEGIIAIVEETMPRDNLLNSACLELFEFIKREGVKQLIVHLAEQYRERLMAITYVNTFQQVVLKYEQMQNGYLPSTNGIDDTSFTTQEGTPARLINGGGRFAGLKEMDHDEEAYFNADDDADDDDDLGLPVSMKAGMPNGASPVRPLVDYPDDEDDDDDDGDDGELGYVTDPEALLASSPENLEKYLIYKKQQTPEEMDVLTANDERERGRGRDRRPVPVEDSPGRQSSPPEPIAVKRRREDEDEDELGKMMGGTKRRNSSLASQTGKVHLDGSESPKGAIQMHQFQDRENHAPVTQHPEQQQQQTTTYHFSLEQQAPRHVQQQQQHILRRKSSIKNSEAGGKFAIKSIAVAAAAAAKTEAAANGEREGDAGGGGGGGG